MPLPNDDSGRPPFTPSPQDAGPGDAVPPPAPPMMRSPYQPDQQLPEDPHNKHHPQLRFPSLHHGGGHGAGHDGEHGQPGVPPIGQPVGQPLGQPPRQEASSGWGAGIGTGVGTGGNDGFAPPQQFSYRPESQPGPPPVSAPPGDGRRKAIVWASVGTVLVAAAVGVGVLAIGGQHSGSIAGPTPTGSPKVQVTNTTATPAKNMAAAWSAPSAGDSAVVLGSWLVDGKTIVRGDAGALKAYDTGTGKALWTFHPPGAGASICAMSQTAASSVGVVQYGANGTCTTVAAIDTDKGKTLWTTPVAVPKGSAPGTEAMVSLDSEVTAWQIGTTITAWSTAGGKQLWTTDVAKAKPACQVAQLGSEDGNLALLENCGADVVVAMKDAHTGRDLWHTSLPSTGLQGAQFTLVNASPVIVHVTLQSGQPVDRYYSFDANGKLLPPINGSGDYGDLDLNVGSQAQKHPMAHVQDNVFIAPTADKDAKASLVAFDLNSGTKLWQAPATASGPVTIVALNKKWVTVLDGGAGGSAARLLAFGTSGGGPTPAGISKETLGPEWSGPAAAAYIAGNRVIVLPAAPKKGADVLAFAWGDAQ